MKKVELGRIDAWWRAANYLSVGQIYLMANPLLREELLAEHVKPRLLGHWGTTPGLNFVYAHLNRAIMARDLNMMYVIGPGHGGPGLVASAWLEGTYSEVYPGIAQDADGMRRLFQGAATVDSILRDDLIERAAAADGPAFLNVLTNCPIGWGHEPRASLEILNAAVDTCFWPLYEVVDGRYRLTYVPERFLPIEDWLRPQARFAHLLRAPLGGVVRRIQDQIHDEWAALRLRCEQDAAAA